MSRLTLAHPPALRDVLPWQLERGAYLYEAFRRASAGRSLETGLPLAAWPYLEADAQRAWIEAACSTCATFSAVH